MTQNYQIGKEFSGSFNQRLEWRLNQIQLALSSGGSSPAVEALLTDLLAVSQLIQQQTDEIELTSENISLNADSINLNTNQVEALLTTIDGHIVALQTQVGTTADVETLLIDVRDRLIAITDNTDAANTKLDALVAEIASSAGNGGIISGSVVPLLQQIRDNTDNIVSAIGAIAPLTFEASNSYNAGTFVVNSALAILADPLRRQLTIINNTGDSTIGTNPIAGQAWIFGSYRNSSVAETDFDFVIEPGQTVNVAAPADAIWLICAEATGFPFGTFNIVEYY